MKNDLIAATLLASMPLLLFLLLFIGAPLAVLLTLINLFRWSAKRGG